MIPNRLSPQTRDDSWAAALITLAVVALLFGTVLAGPAVLGAAGASPDAAASLAGQTPGASPEAPASLATPEPNNVTEANSSDNVALVFIGEEVLAAGFEPGEEVRLRSDPEDEDTFEGQFIANGSGVVTIETEERESNLYTLTGQESGEVRFFELITHELSVETGEGDAEDGGAEDEPPVVRNEGANTDLNFTFDSNRGGNNSVLVRAINQEGGRLSSSQLASIFPNAAFQDTDSNEVALQVRTDETISTNFSAIPTGTYEFSFDSVDTTAVTTATVTVEELGPDTIQFRQIVLDTATGDRVELPLNISGGIESAIIQYGVYEDDGYQLLLKVTPSETPAQTTVELDTYRLGENDRSEDIASATNATVEVLNTTNTESDRIIADTDYYVFVGDEAENGTLPVENVFDIANSQLRDPGEATTHTYPVTSRTAETIRTEASLSAPADDLNESGIDPVTEFDTVAEGDVVAVEFRRSGIDGLVDSYFGASLTDRFQQAIDNNGLEFTVEQTVNSTPRNEQPTVIDLEESNYEVVRTAQSYVMLFDEAALETESGRAVEPGFEYDATLTITDERLLDRADAENTTQTATFQVVNRNVTFDTTRTVSLNVTGGLESEELITATASENTTFEVNTTAAPGTQAQLQVLSLSDTTPPFAFSEDTRVNEFQQISTTVDLSNQEVGQTFQLVVSTEQTDDVAIQHGVITDVGPNVSGPGNGSDTNGTGNATGVSTQFTLVTPSGDSIDPNAVTLSVAGQNITGNETRLPPGEYVVTARAANYTESSVPISISDGQDSASFEIILAPTDDGSGNEGSNGTNSSGNTSTGDGSDSTDPGTDDSSGTTDDGVPGFTGVSAAIALLAVALLATRYRSN